MAWESFSARARRTSSPCPRDRSSVRRIHDGTGRVRRPVASVRPGGEDDDVPHGRQLRHEGQRELLASSARATSPDGHGRLASGDQAGRPPDGRAAPRDLVEDGSEHAGHLARLALEAPGQEAGREPEPSRLLDRRVDDEPVVPDHHVRDAGQDRVAGLRRVRHLAARARLEMGPHRRRHPGAEPEAVQHRQGVVVGGGIGRGRPGGDHVERVADHVGQQERDDRGRVRRPRQLASLEAREVLPDRVQLVDRRARTRGAGASPPASPRG